MAPKLDAIEQRLRRLEQAVADLKKAVADRADAPTLIARLSGVEQAMRSMSNVVTRMYRGGKTWSPDNGG